MKSSNIITTVTVAILTIFAAPIGWADAIVQYNFNERVGTSSYTNIASGSHDLTFNRSVTKSTNYPFYPDQAGANFSGQTKYNADTAGSVSNKETINLNALGGKFTMEGWIYLEGFSSISGTPAGGSLMQLLSAAGGTSLYSLYYTTNGTVMGGFNSQSQAGGTRNFSAGVSLSLNTWTHLAYVYNGTDVKIYMNGELKTTFSEVGISTRPTPTNLSSFTIAGNIYGGFDDIALWDSALATNQLGYHQPFPIPEPTTSALLGLIGLIGIGVLASGVKFLKHKN